MQGKLIKLISVRNLSVNIKLSLTDNFGIEALLKLFWIFYIFSELLKETMLGETGKIMKCCEVNSKIFTFKQHGSRIYENNRNMLNILFPKSLNVID